MADEKPIVASRGRLPSWLLGLIVAGLLFAVGTPPYVYAWLTTPPDKVYTGLMFDVPDHAQYWSWVTASRDGLFISNTMTPEPNPPVFMNPMMWTLARVQTSFGLSFPALFQVWRALAAILLGFALVVGCRSFVLDNERRLSALWIAAVGSGFGWMLVLAKYALALPDVPFPNDIYIVEPNTFFAVLAYPYLALAQALVLLTLAAAWRASRSGHWPDYVLAGASAVALALSHAYDLITVYAVLAAFWLLEVGRTRQVPIRLTAVGLVVGLASGPIALYYQQLTARDALWQAILAQYVNAGVWTPRYLHLVVLMGLPLLLAAWSLIRAVRGGGAGTLLAAWAVVGLGLIYLPTTFQIKLLTGWQFPLAILAAHAWHDRIVPWVTSGSTLSRHLRARQGMVLARLALVMLVVPTNLYLYAWRFTELRRHELPFFLRADEVTALEWLAANARPDDVAIAPLELGQFLPNYGETRAFLAHWAMTNRFYERREAAAKFFAPDTSDDVRRQMLERDRVTLVLRPAPRQEQALYDPRTSPLFEVVFARPEAAVFRYRGPSGGERTGATP